MNILEKIFAICEKKTGFMPKIANSNLRFREMVMCRNLYFKFARKYTQYSLTQIGLIVNRDHATVLHGIKTIDNDINQFNEIENLADDIENTIVDLLKYNNISKVDECISIMKRMIEQNERICKEFQSIREELLMNIEINNDEKLQKTA